MSTCDAPETSPSDPSGGASSKARALAAHATCECAVEQHYQYRWDELNRIAEARRFDRNGTAETAEWTLAARQRYRYDSANVRTVKQTLETITDVVGGPDGIDDTDGDPPERLALYVYPGDLERRGLTRNATRDAYIEAEGQVGEGKTGIAETQYVVGGARVVWEAVDAHTAIDGSVTKMARTTVSIGDLIGTTGAVLDLESGALVEASTYYPNGARESYVCSACGDGAIVPEPTGFTEKEGDEEVGLTYFGERYLVSRVGRWASADPLATHQVSGGEAGNSYHYVSGNLLAGRDPIGLQQRETSQAQFRPPGTTPDHAPTADEQARTAAVTSMMRALPTERRTQATFNRVYGALTGVSTADLQGRERAGVTIMWKGQELPAAYRRIHSYGYQESAVGAGFVKKTGFRTSTWVRGTFLPDGGDQKPPTWEGNVVKARYDRQIRAIVIDENSRDQDILHEFGHAHDFTSGPGAERLTHIDDAGSRRWSTQYAQRQVLLGLNLMPQSATAAVMAAHAALRTRTRGGADDPGIAASGQDETQPYAAPDEAYTTAYSAVRSGDPEWRGRVHRFAPELEALVQ